MPSPSTFLHPLLPTPSSQSVFDDPIPGRRKACWCSSIDPNASTSFSSPPSDPGPHQLRFQPTWVGVGQDRHELRATIEAALGIMSASLFSTARVRIEVRHEALADGVLGAANPVMFRNVRTRPLASQLRSPAHPNARLPSVRQPTCPARCCCATGHLNIAAVYRL